MLTYDWTKKGGQVTPVEGYLLLVEFIARELSFNKKESILSVYDEKVWRLWVRLTNEVCRFLAEYLNGLAI